MLLREFGFGTWNFGSQYHLMNCELLFQLVLSLLPYIQSSCNPVIYGFMSSKFRGSLRRACCCCSCCCAHPSADSRQRTAAYTAELPSVRVTRHGPQAASTRFTSEFWINWSHLRSSWLSLRWREKCFGGIGIVLLLYFIWNLRLHNDRKS